MTTNPKTETRVEWLSRSPKGHDYYERETEMDARRCLIDAMESGNFPDGLKLIRRTIKTETTEEEIK